jgi:ribonuclease-3
MSDELSLKLKYEFKQPHFLKVALTHRSKGGEHNERLEFLGDSVVNFIIAEALYQQFPKATDSQGNGRGIESLACHLSQSRYFSRSCERI